MSGTLGIKHTSAWILRQRSGPHSYKVTAANVHDVTVLLPTLLTGEEEQVVYGDSGYLGAEKRPEARKKNTARKENPVQNQSSSHVKVKNNSARSQAQIKRQ